MRDQYKKEIAQLGSEYGHLDLMWYDGGGVNWLGFGGLERGAKGWQTRDKKTSYKGTFSWHDDEVNARLREAQPTILINDRTDSPADWRSREGSSALGAFEGQQPWELCLTLAGPWGYQPNAKPRPFETIVRLLTNTVSRDGNMLLNVGPDPKGDIPADQVARLKEVGQWLNVYGPAIYDTRGGPFLPTPTVTSTRRGNTVFIHLMPDKGGRWPQRVALPALPESLAVRSARVLATGATIECATAADGRTEVTLPSTWPDAPRGVPLAESVCANLLDQSPIHVG
jgi:alpha-L-fucosidase